MRVDELIYILKAYSVFLVYRSFFKKFSFQAESPSTNQLSALSVYLLTCLFFVGCAILEFAYLLHRSRSDERRMDSKKMKQFPEKMYIVEEVKSSRDQNVEEETMNAGNNSGANRGKKELFWIESDVIKFNRCNLNIDVLSQWIFFFAFVLFNIFYWIYYLHRMLSQ